MIRQKRLKKCMFTECKKYGNAYAHEYFVCGEHAISVRIALEKEAPSNIFKHLKHRGSLRIACCAKERRE